MLEAFHFGTNMSVIFFSLLHNIVKFPCWFMAEIYWHGNKWYPWGKNEQEMWNQRATFKRATFKTSKQRLMNMAHYKTFFKSLRPVRVLCILVFFLEMIWAKSSYSRDKEFVFTMLAFYQKTPSISSDFFGGSPPGGVLDQWLGIGVPLRVSNPDPV